MIPSGPLVTFDTLQLSPDGKTPAACSRGRWRRRRRRDGLAAADGRRLLDGAQRLRALLFWHFDGAHRNLLMADVRSDRRWTVPINRAPGFDNPEVYHPRWARHPRFMAMSGPYDRGGANQVRSGGAQAEIWMGRFSGDYTAIEQWAPVSRNGRGDSYPDIWIDIAKSPHRPRERRVGPLAANRRRSRPAASSSRLASSRPAPCRTRRRSRRTERPRRQRLRGGARPRGQRPGPLAVAHWAIRDARVLPEARARRGVRRLVLERYEAHPELEGERLIQDRRSRPCPSTWKCPEWVASPRRHAVRPLTIRAPMVSAHLFLFYFLPAALASTTSPRRACGTWCSRC